MTGRWRERAACAGLNPDAFFPLAEVGPAYEASVRAAKAVCARCPVRKQCLAFAMTDMPYGIAGGFTAEERRALRRAAQIRAGAA